MNSPLEVTGPADANTLGNRWAPIKASRARWTHGDCRVSGRGGREHAGWERTHHCRREARLCEVAEGAPLGGSARSSRAVW